MCDYSLQNVSSRPAKVGDRLTTRDFGTGTRGFCAAEDAGMAVCILPGTELSFAGDVACKQTGLFPWRTRLIESQDRHLPADQYPQACRASRCTGISGRTHLVADIVVRRTASDGSAAAGAAEDGRRSCGATTRGLYRLVPQFEATQAAAQYRGGLRFNQIGRTTSASRQAFPTRKTRPVPYGP